MDIALSIPLMAMGRLRCMSSKVTLYPSLALYSRPGELAYSVTVDVVLSGVHQLQKLKLKSVRVSLVYFL